MLVYIELYAAIELAGISSTSLTILTHVSILPSSDNCIATILGVRLVPAVEISSR